MLWIRHVGEIVQFHAVRLHVRNIDSAKQWPDITRERNRVRGSQVPELV